LCLCLSCSNITVPTEEVVLSSDGEYFTITNSTAEKVYYFAVESSCAARLNWGPTKTSPYIYCGGSAKILYNDIFNGSDPNLVKAGDRIIVYTWTENHKDYHDISTTVIIL